MGEVKKNGNVTAEADRGAARLAGGTRKVIKGDHNREFENTLDL